MESEYDSETAEAAGAKLVSKDELFREADIITIHLILSARTKGSRSLIGLRGFEDGGHNLSRVGYDSGL